MRRLFKLSPAAILSLLSMILLTGVIAWDASDRSIRSAYTEFDAEHWEASSGSASVEQYPKFDLFEPSSDLELMYFEFEAMEDEDVSNWLETNGGSGKASIRLSTSSSIGAEWTALENTVNAEVEVKKSTYDNILKSLRVRLYDRAGLWNGQNVIVLDKNNADALRIREKLSFDLLASSSEIPSMRTQFVRLFARGDGRIGDYADLGFYTSLENPNKQFMKSHGLDPEGALYEFEDFDFELTKTLEESLEKPEAAADLSVHGLKALENPDHKKLLRLLRAVNDSEADGQAVLDKHFSPSNYLRWISTNILMDSYDVSTDNFLLYSPLNSEKWYFIPCDFDRTWGNDKDRQPWQSGVAMFWDSRLHRLLLKPALEGALQREIDRVQAAMAPEMIRDRLDSYSGILFANITKMPDFAHLGVAYADFKATYAELPQVPGTSRGKFEASLEKPMPFGLNPIQQAGSFVTFSWEASESLSGSPVTYSFELARRPDFKVVARTEAGLETTELSLNGLEPGTYYMRVSALDAGGRSQMSYTSFKDPFGTIYPGIIQLHIQ